MIHESVYELRKDIKNAVKIEHGKLEVVDAEALEGLLGAYRALLESGRVPGGEADDD